MSRIFTCFLEIIDCIYFLKIVYRKSKQPAKKFVLLGYNWQMGKWLVYEVVNYPLAKTSINQKIS